MSLKIIEIYKNGEDRARILEKIEEKLSGLGAERIETVQNGFIFKGKINFRNYDPISGLSYGEIKFFSEDEKKMFFRFRLKYRMLFKFMTIQFLVFFGILLTAAFGIVRGIIAVFLLFFFFLVLTFPLGIMLNYFLFKWKLEKINRYE